MIFDPNSTWFIFLFFFFFFIILIKNIILINFYIKYTLNYNHYNAILAITYLKTKVNVSIMK
jgi:hypothetical protein